ncbi:MAG TPA: radical SAM family heme chaperone HemW [Muribaculaceae bacterium]|jgi:oxygen-independent coproporphyrinogen-3 oxidase|nr:radical SAM family heme chaperone HemW [Muribaculaceae bacterium]
MAGIYIHIPYCHSKCAYCDFYSIPSHKSEPALISDAIIQEWDYRKNEITEPVETIYIGGGTPSCIPSQHISDILAQLPVTGCKEVTIEVNPEDVTPDLICRYVDAGVNRVSMGIQSLIDGELEYVGRRHTASQALEAIDIIRRAGINNISCDLIFGLPGQDIDTWKHSLTVLTDKHPEHISAYMLSYEPGTRLHARLSSGKIVPSSEELLECMYGMLCAHMKESGYLHYEISNFSLPGFRSVHNSNYWKDMQYLGLGPSAVSFDGRSVRRTNLSDIRKYIKDIQNGGALAMVEHETTVDRVNDALLVGLRTMSGVNIDSLSQAYGDTYARSIMNAADSFLQRGLLILRDGSLIVPESEWMVCDMIIRELFVS